MSPLDAILSPVERDRIARVLRLPIWRKAHLALKLHADPRVTRLMALPLAIVIIYVVLPINLVPRRIPVVRAFDNLAVGVLGLWLFVKLMPPAVLDEHLQALEGHP